MFMVSAVAGYGWRMADAKGKAKEALGWLTADRDVEAEGRAEQETTTGPSDKDVDESKDEVREQYGETPDGSDSPDDLH
jgi:uncharacterized protein YjbJ (UPF0337 family)